MSIEKTLAERGQRYGEFEHHAKIAQRLQDAMRDNNGWDGLQADQKQALTVIADKIARMLNGDPNYLDNWHDIIGYAKLVETRMIRDQAPKQVVEANELTKEQLAYLKSESAKPYSPDEIAKLNAEREEAQVKRARTIEDAVRQLRQQAG